MPMYRVSKKTHFQNATEPMVHWHNHQLANTPYVGKSIFWSFLTKTKQDQALPSHVHGKIWPQSAQFRLQLFSISTLFWDTLYILVCVFRSAASSKTNAVKYNKA